MSNGYGPVHVTRQTDLDAYDACPPRLRWMLRNAVSPFSALHFLRRYRDERLYASADKALAECARRISLIDAQQTLAAYGPTHPEARPITDEAAA